MIAGPWLRKHSLALKLLSSLVATCLFIVCIEQATRLAIKAGWIRYQPPMITQLPAGTEDWRHAHMTADKLRQPDPVLWWRPRDGSPYNNQGFKGPPAEVPKSPQTVRILVYGDSNTEGTPEDSWPDRLQSVLTSVERQTHRRYEVLNAGVAGYTSHQGLLRFQQEVEQYQPDMVLVAFGWNDLARGVQPDRSYHPPPAPVVTLERALLKLHSYWALKQWVLTRSAARAAKTTVARVPIEDYRENLSQFALLAGRHGAAAVLITRPHRDAIDKLHSMSSSYFTAVPEYNQALLRVARQSRAHSVDAEQHFLQLSDPTLWGDECHFTEPGRIEMGRFVFQQLKQLGLL